MVSREEIEEASDSELMVAMSAIRSELSKRERKAAPSEKAALAKAEKRDPRCPVCHAVLDKDGIGRNGAQRYRCPVCKARYSDSSNTSLSSSKLTKRKIAEIITMVMLDCPDWVISWICRVNVKTAQYWRDRCLDAAQAWSMESKLEGHVWMDEMRFAPTRATGFIDGVWTTYGGKIAMDTYMEVAFDSSGQGFCKVYGKLGMPTRAMVWECCKGRIAEGSTLTHDGALSHNMTVKGLGLEDDWHKFVRGDKEYEKAMLLMSNCCSYLRYEFESHRGIKASKLGAYGDFFMYKWCHVRKYGLRASIEYLFNRVCGTPKSHIFANSFSKTSVWPS